MSSKALLVTRDRTIDWHPWMPRLVVDYTQDGYRCRSYRWRSFNVLITTVVYEQ